MKSEVKVCQNCKQSFAIDPEDFGFYEKMQVPPPTWCPECRMMRRWIFRCDRGLYRRPESINNTEIFSGMPPEATMPVYSLDYWDSDAWDPLSYGRDYNFSRPFFEQFLELMYAVPWPGKNAMNLVNSEYTNQAGYCKNTYLCFDCDETEDSAYIVGCAYLKNCFDMNASFNNELSYENLFLDESYQTFFSEDCESCTNVWFSRNLIGCADCFGCVNLRNKSYYIFNRPYTKEEYQKKLKEFNLGSYQGLSAMKKRVYEFWEQFPYKYIRGAHNENVIGEYTYHSKNAKYTYQVKETENVAYSQQLGEANDSYDYTIWGWGSELMYEAMCCGDQMQNIKFSLGCWPSSTNIQYSDDCHSSNDIFGCIGLQKKQYCILNKQYPKQEYEVLVPKIIQHMKDLPYTDARGRVYRYGEFFPVEFSPFAYNESVVNEFFPLSKEEAVKRGFLWREHEPSEYKISLKSGGLPDHINDVTEAILKEVIECGNCKKAYRIVPAELTFYKRFSLPLPRLCHNCRHLERLKQRTPVQWWKRQCACDYAVYKNYKKHDHHPVGRCPNEFETSYASEKKEIIYCEACYQLEVI